MSMIGHYLAIPQDELDTLQDEPERITFLIDERYADEVVDLDKAWHGIHFILSDEEFQEEPLLANAIFGVDEIGEEDVGYGPARGTPAAAVRQIAVSLSQVSEEAFREKFDPVALESADVYPQMWEEGDEALEYLVTYFLVLKDFYARAAEENKAVITYLG